MTVCKFFLQNRCAFGSSCKFEHPADKQGAANLIGAGNSSSGSTGSVAFGRGNSAFGGATSAFGAGNGVSSGSLTARFGSAAPPPTFGRSTTGSNTASGSAFGAFGGNASSGGFGGQASQTGTSVFGGGNGSAFGTPSSQSSSAFGGISQPSAFGGSPQPSAFGGKAPSAFGQPATFGSAQRPETFGSSASVAPISGSSAPTSFYQVPAHVAPGQVNLSQETIDEDLRLNRPLWRPSVFGPAKYEPNLISGCDVSPDELRVEALLAMSAGGSATQVYIQREEEACRKVDEAVVQSLSNKTQAVKQAEANRAQALARIKAGSSNTPSSSIPGPVGNGQFAFGRSNPGPSATAGVASAFGGGGTGQPSAFGSPSAFGQPSAFGLPSSNTTSAFGQPSGFGTTSVPSTFGSASGGTTFGVSQPSQAGFDSGSGSGSFGSAQPSRGFGQSVAPPAFGQSSAFGAPASGGTGNTFGQATAPSAFGGPGALKESNAFGSTQGAQPSAPASAASAQAGGLGGSFLNNQGKPSAGAGFSNAPSPFSIPFGGGMTAASSAAHSDPYASFSPKEESLPEKIRNLFMSEEYEWGGVPGVEPPVGVR